MSSDSEDAYLSGDESDDQANHQVTKRGYGTRSSGPVSDVVEKKSKGAAWETLERTWDELVEGADGNINSVVNNLRDAGKRKRLVMPLVDLAPFKCLQLGAQFLNPYGYSSARRVRKNQYLCALDCPKGFKKLSSWL